MRRWARHWLRACREVPDRALAALDRHNDDPGRQVHEFRRLMKAWRALLKLAPARLAEQAHAVRSAAGSLRRGFGMARDTAVIAKVLGKLCPGQVREDDTEAVARLVRDQGEAVRAELRRLSAEMAGWSLADETGEFLARAFRRSYRRARREAQGNPRRMSIESLHGWRTAVVDLGYQLSFFAPADPARLRHQAKEAERLRGRLGNAIDLDMAGSYLAEEPAPDSGGASSEWLVHEISRKIARQRRRAAKLAERLLERRPKRASADLREAMAQHPPRRVSLA